MSRLTITLDDEIHRALKETAARQGRTIGKIIEESLLLRGIKRLENAKVLVERARANARFNEKDALELAVKEIKIHRDS